MNEYLDIATSLYTNSLTLFVGTGFSKYMTNGKAPSWLELIVECTRKIDQDNKLFNQLFNTDSSGKVKEAKYDLTVCAQILEGEYTKKKKNIRIAITEIIKLHINKSTLDQAKLDSLQKFFSVHPNINIITTNYDTIFSDYVIPLTSRVIIEGSTIPRINSGQNIYHIHGCISNPSSIILTLNDYYNFQNSNNYFSRKFFTLLQETTVVIIGYSLGDFNLNSILNEVKSTKKESFRKTDIYYISKDGVTDLIERFYYLTYAIKVIHNTEILILFEHIDNEFDVAKDLIETAENLKDVMTGTKSYTEKYLKLRISLAQILLQAASLGIESSNKDFNNLVLTLLNQKKEFTYESGAWDQYEQLADWLIEIASTIIIKDTEMEIKFCEIATYSFKKCTRVQYKGYSWHAWTAWNNRWNEMKIQNQIMLQDLIESNKWDPDLEITEIYK